MKKLLQTVREGKPAGTEQTVREGKSAETKQTVREGKPAETKTVNVSEDGKPSEIKVNQLCTSISREKKSAEIKLVTRAQELKTGWLQS